MALADLWPIVAIHEEANKVFRYKVALDALRPTIKFGTPWLKATTRPLEGTSLGEDARGLGFRMPDGRVSVSPLLMSGATWRSTQSLFFCFFVCFFVCVFALKALKFDQISHFPRPGAWGLNVKCRWRQPKLCGFSPGFPTSCMHTGDVKLFVSTC